MCGHFVDVLLALDSKPTYKPSGRGSRRVGEGEGGLPSVGSERGGGLARDGQKAASRIDELLPISPFVVRIVDLHHVQYEHAGMTASVEIESGLSPAAGVNWSVHAEKRNGRPSPDFQPA